MSIKRKDINVFSKVYTFSLLNMLGFSLIIPNFVWIIMLNRKTVIRQMTLPCFSKKVAHALIGFWLLVPTIVFAQDNNNSYTIPIESNTFVTQKNKATKPTVRIGQNGLFLPANATETASTFFYIKEPSSPSIQLIVKGNANIQISCNDLKKTIKVNSKEWEKVSIGKLAIAKAGYVRIDFSSSRPNEGGYALVKQLIISDVQQKPLYIAEGFSSHFGRRGPSVHLQYKMPDNKNVEWFYNEVTVPKEGDVIGSYYCAQGFHGGYFGFQHNSESERRILFSIWSPFDTQDPRKIPDEDKIVVLKHGKDVNIGEFGNEGSGGQTFLRYNWQAGNTYKFLLHVRPDEKENTTTYTAFFYAPELNEWLLIASMKRPRTYTWVSGAYSFVENFSPNQGYLTRKAYFENPWACDEQGEWTPITETRFTNDATGDHGIRVDYLGGTEGNRFFLKMGGFFGDGSHVNRHLKIQATGPRPTINFDKLSK